MATAEPLTLGGCAPTPLASYLKAIGALRLISSDANHVDGNAADPNARGWWENDQFQLSTRLSREELRDFFLQEYSPTPIIGAWNGRAGFLEGDASNRKGADLMQAIEISETCRLANMRRIIDALRKNKELGKFDRLRAEEKRLKQEITKLSGREKEAKEQERKRVESESKKTKSFLLQNLRSTADSEHLHYIDACYMLSKDEHVNPLLGSGGNDGSRDLGVNFAECLRDLFDFATGIPTDQGRGEIEAALFGTNWRLNRRDSIGQFSLGQGGPNATTGYAGSGRINSWDLAFALEGTVAFAGAATRRHPGASESGASFPFTVRHMVGAGWGGVEATDEDDARAEFWAPLWQRPARFVEIMALFSEGRAVLNGRTARSGLDFARAARDLGTSRGFNEFIRYGFLKRVGKSYLATSLGRCSATPSRAAALVADLDKGGWLDRLRRAGRQDGEPVSTRQAIKRFEDALFDLAGESIPATKIQRTIIALGGICGRLAVIEKGSAEIGPPPVLSNGWIRLADDASPEFRIAVALAGIGLKLPSRRDEPSLGNSAEDQDQPSTETTVQSTPTTRPAPPMASHFSRINEASYIESLQGSRRRAWSDHESSPSVVWDAGDLAKNMISVLERRLVEGTVRGLDDKPLEGAIYARLSDVGAFLSDGFDDARCASLLRGLIWARPTLPRSSPPSNEPGSSIGTSIPFAYAALKPIFTPDHTLRKIGALSETVRLPIPNGLIARLRAAGGSRHGHATNLAVREALARARASGWPSPFGFEQAAGLRAADTGGCIGAGLRADRLAASLLIPISEEATKSLVKRAFPEVFPDEIVETEVTNHDA